jgi:toxin YoeB
MSYTLQLTTDAIQDIERLKKAGDKATLRKLAILFEELTEHPRTPYFLRS